MILCFLICMPAQYCIPRNCNFFLKCKLLWISLAVLKFCREEFHLFVSLTAHELWSFYTSLIVFTSMSTYGVTAVSGIIQAFPAHGSQVTCGPAQNHTETQNCRSWRDLKKSESPTPLLKQFPYSRLHRHSLQCGGPVQALGTQWSLNTSNTSVL